MRFINVIVAAAFFGVSSFPAAASSAKDLRPFVGAEITKYYKSLPNTLTPEGDICWFGSSSWETWCFSGGSGVDQHNKPKIPSKYYMQLGNQHETVFYEGMNFGRLKGQPDIIFTTQTVRINDPGDPGTSSIVVKGSTRTKCRTTIDGDIGSTYPGSDNYTYQGTKRGNCTSTNSGFTIPGIDPDPGGYKQYAAVIEVKCSDMTYRSTNFRDSILMTIPWRKISGKFKQAHYSFWCDRKHWWPEHDAQIIRDLIGAPRS